MRTYFYYLSYTLFLAGVVLLCLFSWGNGMSWMLCVAAILLMVAVGVGLCLNCFPENTPVQAEKPKPLETARTALLES